MNATIEETIERVEQLYTTLTGTRPPRVNGNNAPIPPESDPMVYVEEQLARMVAAIEQVVPAAAPTPTWTPRAVAWTEESGVVLALDVPGVPREQIQIAVDGRMLVVSGQRPAPAGRMMHAITACEVPFGAFTRSFVLATPVVPAHVSARLEQGVLTIRVSSVRGEASQIPIRS
jgi:HSP20 family protein